MSDSYLALLNAVVARLKADATLTGLVGSRVYTDVKDNPVFPFVRIEIQSADYSTKDNVGMEHTIQVSAFSRKTDPAEAAQIRSAVFNSLNRAENSLSAVPVSNILHNGVSLIFKESDGKTWNSTIQFRAIVL